jgi:hypothetical protein
VEGVELVSAEQADVVVGEELPKAGDEFGLVLGAEPVGDRGLDVMVCKLLIWGAWLGMQPESGVTVGVGEEGYELVGTGLQVRDELLVAPARCEHPQVVLSESDERPALLGVEKGHVSVEENEGTSL